MRSIRNLAGAIAVFFVFSVLPAAVFAHEIVVEDVEYRRLAPNVRYQHRVTLTDYRVDVKIDNQVSRVTISQKFHSNFPRPVEGTYIYPLPDDAAIDSFTLTMNGETLEGKILEKGEAARIYRSIVSRLRDPGLLEYVGTKMISCKVFPIPANGDVKIDVHYTQLLKSDASLVEFSYPLSTSNFNRYPIPSVFFNFNVKSDVQIKSAFSPTHKVSVTRVSDNEMKATYEGSNVIPDKDFRFMYGVGSEEVGLTVIPHRIGDDDGYFLMMMTPALKTAKDKILPKEVVFTLDVSGSMQGRKIEQAISALKHCVKALAERDRFNIITFSDELMMFEERTVKATAENKKKAVDWLSDRDALGGTMLADAVVESLRQNSEGAGIFIVALLTDGLPTIGERDPGKILEMAGKAGKPNGRLFVFGVGDNLNAKLIDKLALGNNGTTTYMAEDEDIERKVSSFYNKMSNPVLSGVTVNVDGVKLIRTYPNAIGDLFAGEQIVLVGRYSGSGSTEVTISGKFGDEERKFAFKREFPVRDSGGGYIKRLWAVRRVGFLLDNIRLNGENDELKQEIIRLGKTYGIVTPYTSFLAAPERDMPGFGKDLGARGGVPARPDDSPSSETELRSGLDKKEKGEVDAEHEDGGYAADEAGAKAVEEARSAGKLRRALSREDLGRNSANIREAAGTTFYYVSGYWVQAGIKAGDLEEATNVEYLSDAYFDLLLKGDDIKSFLAVGYYVVFKADGKVYMVVPEKEGETGGSE